MCICTSWAQTTLRGGSRDAPAVAAQELGGSRGTTSTEALSSPFRSPGVPVTDRLWKGEGAERVRETRTVAQGATPSLGWARADTNEEALMSDTFVGVDVAKAEVVVACRPAGAEWNGDQ